MEETNIIQPGQNTGVILVSPSDSDFVSGAETGIVEITRNTAGDWRKSEPDGEWQRDMVSGFESDACVSFSANDALETLGDQQIALDNWNAADVAWLKSNGYFNADGTLNFSDRFTAKMSGTTTNGNSLPAVWQSIHVNGLVPETAWPFPLAEIQANVPAAWNIYYGPVPASIVALGQQFLQRFSISYEWVYTAPGQSNAAIIAAALKIAPLQIATAVCAPWNTAAPINGCGPGAAHATLLTYVDSQNYHILDHYVPFDKLLALNYDISYGMRGIIEPIAVTTPVATTKPGFNHVFNTNLAYGNTGTEVTYLQQALQILTNPLGKPYMTPGVFGPFGPQTKVALAAFQKDNSIVDDGTHFGPLTRQAVNNSLAAKITGYNAGSMNTISTVLTSKTAWTFIALFVFGGLTAIEPSVPAVLKFVVDGTLTVLGTYFHFSAVNQAVETGAAK